MNQRKTTRFLQGRTMVLLTLSLFKVNPAFAVDTTPPTTPVVTDDGVYTTSTTTLHASWTSSDPESGIAEYQYQIRQDSTWGTILVNWTSTGATPSVTQTDLTLTQGKKYFFCVKAKNGDGLWSSVGYSDGIKVDTTAPTAPGQPTEGGIVDQDYDGDGNYPVYWWPAASDPESGIAAYELQEKVGPGGAWTTLSDTITPTNFPVTGRLDKTQYFYQVRAKNGAGLWGPWSVSSDGILVDKTPPTTPATVTDDGVYTTNATQLHATWTPSGDPESGIVDYQYQIRQDSTWGTILVNWTSVGVVTEVTKTGLTLLHAKKYFIGVKAKNGAGLYSGVRYSDGIQVDKNLPAISALTPADKSRFYQQAVVPISVTASDADGDLLSYRFFVDGMLLQDWSTLATATWYTAQQYTTPAGFGWHTIRVEVKDFAYSVGQEVKVFLFRRPPSA